MVAERDTALASALRYGAQILRRHGVRLALVFVGLLLPLWMFGELADEIHEQEAIAFDEPLAAPLDLEPHSPVVAARNAASVAELARVPTVSR